MDFMGKLKSLVSGAENGLLTVLSPRAAYDIHLSNSIEQYIGENLSVLENRRKAGCSRAANLLGTYQMHNGFSGGDSYSTFLLSKAFHDYMTHYYGRKQN